MSNILDEIVSVKRDEIVKLRKEFTLSRFKDSEFFEKSKFSLIDTIKASEDISIIAEIKKASPSKGIIRDDFNPLKIAEIYTENGASAISILTDVNFFKGSIKYLNDAAKEKALPLLRKDFILDEFQIYEAKSNGADAVLLISEILSANQIQELTHVAKEADLEVLLELHSEEQLSKINFGLNNLIGINNRNLNDFSVAVDTTVEIKKLLPQNVQVISESGINGEEEINLLKEEKVNGVLIGEHFMRAKNISDSLKQMYEWCRYES
jgi:indole-3-glycerol phosphate synthase